MFELDETNFDLEKNIFFSKIMSENIKSENLGNFAGIFEHPYIPEYYLISCAECIGTKIIPMARRKMWSNIAHDLVAMCLNDLICTGARPMFFLDYLATNSLNVDNAGKFISTLRVELEKYNCSLLCGKTAELGSIIEADHFDVGGFMTGIIKKEKLLTKEKVTENDIVIGFKSNGLHTAGFSVIRSLYNKKLIEEEIFENLLEPSYIYSNVVEKLCEKNLIKSASHISNGGIGKNILRAVPFGLCADIHLNEVPKQEIFEKLIELIGFEKTYKNFNMGIGFLTIASEENISEILEIAKEFDPFVLGSIRQAITKEEKNTRICLK
ncbi:MAG: phosphoribosylformylglycinamidine cyclo-ligase [Cyanobacteria bacterium SIG30]|nr:phosphoribosylformylglycinamidine cyclo-ligase [Cyanobacteria bacterium SIG30]